eukprot:TRINITY_DN12799_c0_g1_i1.p1 TRINITY_DN12799_c0_g1~~TRINITY_DN12799_c0_g1_i1.p1  ORF type:complete len:887 (+),score=290.35 TRINITY_DN12799_c0_g1_i1:75-2735(+)
MPVPQLFGLDALRGPRVRVSTPTGSTGRRSAPDAASASVCSQLGLRWHARMQGRDTGVSVLTQGTNAEQGSRLNALLPDNDAATESEEEQPPPDAAQPPADPCDEPTPQRRFSARLRQLQSALQRRRAQVDERLQHALLVGDTAVPQRRRKAGGRGLQVRTQPRKPAVQCVLSPRLAAEPTPAELELEARLRQGNLVGFHGQLAELLVEAHPQTVLADAQARAEGLEQLDDDEPKKRKVQRPRTAGAVRPLRAKLDFLRGSEHRRHLFAQQVARRRQTPTGDRLDASRQSLTRGSRSDAAAADSATNDASLAIDSAAELTAAAKQVVAQVGFEAIALKSRVDEELQGMEPANRRTAVLEWQQAAEAAQLFAKDATQVLELSISAAQDEIAGARKALSPPASPTARPASRPHSACGPRTAVGTARQAAARAARVAAEVRRGWLLSQRHTAQQHSPSRAGAQIDIAVTPDQVMRKWMQVVMVARGFSMFHTLHCELSVARSLREEDARDAAARVIQRGLCSRVRQWRLDRTHVCIHRLRAGALSKVLVGAFRRHLRRLALPRIKHFLIWAKASFALRARIARARFFERIVRIQRFVRKCQLRRHLQLSVMDFQWKQTEESMIAANDLTDTVAIRNEVRAKAQQYGLLTQRTAKGRKSRASEAVGKAAGPRAPLRKRAEEDQTPLGALVRLQAWELSDEQLRRIAEEVGLYRRRAYGQPPLWRSQKLRAQLRRKRREHREAMEAHNAVVERVRKQRERRELAAKLGLQFGDDIMQAATPPQPVEDIPPTPTWSLLMDPRSLKQYIEKGWTLPADAEVGKEAGGELFGGAAAHYGGVSGATSVRGEEQAGRGQSGRLVRRGSVHHANSPAPVPAPVTRPPPSRAKRPAPG